MRTPYTFGDLILGGDAFPATVPCMKCGEPALLELCSRCSREIEAGDAKLCSRCSREIEAGAEELDRPAEEADASPHGPSIEGPKT